MKLYDITNKDSIKYGLKYWLILNHKTNKAYELSDYLTFQHKLTKETLTNWFSLRNIIADDYSFYFSRKNDNMMVYIEAFVIDLMTFFDGASLSQIQIISEQDEIPEQFTTLINDCVLECNVYNSNGKLLKQMNEKDRNEKFV